MSSCSPPSITKVYQTPPVEEPCELFSDWKPCSGCASNGYNINDAVQVCINGKKYIARSLVDNNTDEPKAGSVSVPPTWQMKTLAQWLFD